MSALRPHLMGLAIVALCACAEQDGSSDPPVSDAALVDTAKDDATKLPDAALVDVPPIDDSTAIDAAMEASLADSADASDGSDAHRADALSSSDGPVPSDEPEPADVRDEPVGVDAPVDRAPPDAAPLFDSVPAGSVLSFNAPECPVGWVLYREAAGRVIVPTTGGAAGGSVRGVPLSSGEVRTHSHALNATFSIPAVSYAGLSGGGNFGLGAAGNVNLASSSEPGSSELPYVQLLSCRKTGPASAHALPLPRGMMVFFAGEACPVGFTQPAGTQGRYPVALPDGAMPNAGFGGTALGAGEAPSHTHAFSLSMTTSPHGIALLSGGLAGGYAQDGTRTATGTTDSAEPAIPRIELLQCEKD